VDFQWKTGGFLGAKAGDRGKRTMDGGGVQGGGVTGSHGPCVVRQKRGRDWGGKRIKAKAVQCTKVDLFLCSRGFAVAGGNEGGKQVKYVETPSRGK